MGLILCTPQHRPISASAPETFFQCTTISSGFVVRPFMPSTISLPYLSFQVRVLCPQGAAAWGLRKSAWTVHHRYSDFQGKAHMEYLGLPLHVDVSHLSNSFRPRHISSFSSVLPREARSRAARKVLGVSSEYGMPFGPLSYLRPPHTRTLSPPRRPQGNLQGPARAAPLDAAGPGGQRQRRRRRRRRGGRLRRAGAGAGPARGERRVPGHVVVGGDGTAGGAGGARGAARPAAAGPAGTSSRATWWDIGWARRGSQCRVTQTPVVGRNVLCVSALTTLSPPLPLFLILIAESGVAAQVPDRPLTRGFRGPGPH